MLRLSYGDGTTSARACAAARRARSSETQPSARMRGWAGIGILAGPASTSVGASCAVGVLLEVLEQRLAALVAIDATQIQHEVVAGCRARRARRARRRGRRGSSPMPIDRRRLQRPRPRARRDERFLFGREEQIARRRRKKSSEHVEIDRRDPPPRSAQHGAVGDERQAEERRGVAERPEEHEVVRRGRAARRCSSSAGRSGPFSRNHSSCALARARRRRTLVAEVGERLEAPRPRDRKAHDAHAVIASSSPAGYAFAQVT